MVSTIIVVRLIAMTLLLVTVYGFNLKENKNNMLKEPETRIFKGMKARRSQFRYHADIRIYDGYFDYTYGGSIISHWYILTTAEIKIIEEDKEMTMDVYIGNTCEYKGKKYAISPEKIIIHEDFEVSSIQNDIAIIETSEKIIYTVFIENIKLSYASPKTSFENFRTFTSGFGGSKKLLYTSLTILPNSRCAKYEEFQSEKQICAEAKDGRNPTYGDAGSALIETTSDPKNPKLIGILTAATENEPGNNDPVIYTRIGPYIKWITEKTNLIFD